jgi:hypothetical protein
MNIGDKYIDTYNEFNNPNFNFIEGQSYDPEKSIVEIVDITPTSVCVKLRSRPLRIMYKDGGGISKPLDNYNQWFKLKREHEEEIGFHFRFTKSVNNNQTK